MEQISIQYAINLYLVPFLEVKTVKIITEKYYTIIAFNIPLSKAIQYSQFYSIQLNSIKNIYYKSHFRNVYMRMKYNVI